MPSTSEPLPGVLLNTGKGAFTFSRGNRDIVKLFSAKKRTPDQIVGIKGTVIYLTVIEIIIIKISNNNYYNKKYYNNLQFLLQWTDGETSKQLL